MKTLVLLSTLLLFARVATAQDPVMDRIENSPRHHEWVTVTHGDRDVHAFVTFPEVEGPVPAVVVIHENRGLNDWARSMTDMLAEAGYVAIAPDLLSGVGPDGGKTSDFASTDAAREAIYQLPADQITADLNAVTDYVAGLPAVNGSVVVAGFCWGGSQTFRFATNRADLKAAYVFYGTAPDDAEALARIGAPVYGFYGGADARVDATIPQTEERMKAAGKTYEPVLYDGAGHAFMRRGMTADPDDANAKAYKAAWERLVSLLKEI